VGKSSAALHDFDEAAARINKWLTKVKHVGGKTETGRQIAPPARLCPSARAKRAAIQLN
jgi:hypothetical protein